MSIGSLETSKIVIASMTVSLTNYMATAVRYRIEDKTLDYHNNSTTLIVTTYYYTLSNAPGRILKMFIDGNTILISHKI